jgi:hypothetical protein
VTGRSALAVSLLLLGSCSQQLPPVSIASVTPGEMVPSQPTAVSVQVVAELAFQVDYGSGTLTADSVMHVKVGPLELGAGTYPPEGLVHGTLPTVMAPGTYDVTVNMGDGRKAVLPNAFTVLDGGTWPSAYTIDSIGNQRSGLAFPVTLRAVGPEASSFDGNILLGVVGAGTLAPLISGEFSAGVRAETVTVTGTGEFMLSASDIAGHNGQSAPFTVAP